MQFSTETRKSLFETCHEDFLNFLKNHGKKHLFDHQVNCLLKIYDFFSKPSSPSTALCVLPTGSGKSGIAVLTPYVLKAKRVLILTPSIYISRQIEHEFHGRPSFLESRNIIQESQRSNIIERPLVIYKTNELKDVDESNLIIANAHKFGTTSSVDMSQIPQDIFDLIIVDEAHHYPAPTWKRIVDHFPKSKKIFLTATPYNQGQEILPNQNQNICYEMQYSSAIENKIIRELDWKEVGTITDNELVRIELVGRAVFSKLYEHDQQDKVAPHQAMVLTRTQNEADLAARCFNALLPGQAKAFHGLSKNEAEKEFRKGEFKVLVVCGKLLEGFDRKEVSVVAILRNVSPKSRVLFSQFVGRSLRRLHKDETIKACLVSHVAFNQKFNYDHLDTLNTEDPEDEIFTEEEPIPFQIPSTQFELPSMNINVRDFFPYLRNEKSWKKNIVNLILEIPTMVGFAFQEKKICFFGKDENIKMIVLQKLLPINFVGSVHETEAPIIPITAIPQLNNSNFRSLLQSQGYSSGLVPCLSGDYKLYIPSQNPLKIASLVWDILGCFTLEKVDKIVLSEECGQPLLKDGQPWGSTGAFLKDNNQNYYLLTALHNFSNTIHGYYSTLGFNVVRPISSDTLPCDDDVVICKMVQPLSSSLPAPSNIVPGTLKILSPPLHSLYPSKIFKYGASTAKEVIMDVQALDFWGKISLDYNSSSFIYVQNFQIGRCPIYASNKGDSGGPYWVEEGSIYHLFAIHRGQITAYYDGIKIYPPPGFIFCGGTGVRSVLEQAEGYGISMIK